MSKTVVVYTCCHSDPDVPNDRATWLGEFLYDLKPDYVVDLGDTADMRSLNTFDTRYPQKMVMQSYEKDIEHHLDFQERIRHKFKRLKTKRPTFYGLEGNHEYRITKAIMSDPRLAGEKRGISTKHLETERFYDEYYPFQNEAPAIVDLDGVSYAHYITTGALGRPVSGEHHAFSLLKKRYHSTTVGHSHKRSLFFKDDAHPRGAIGLVAGCYKGGEETWAGQSNKEWWKGVVIKRNLEDGIYEPEFVSLARLQKEYGGKS